ncbi:PIR protein [Plasmodium ovale]|uniref:PIR protein n=1 Tax=Plasmodium ovale TaxID=36330 RepID=A0A1D3JCZ2_PLAOA|nr:PIR protein [Plasmodium ovale]
MNEENSYWNTNHYEKKNKKKIFWEYDYDLNDWVEMKDLHNYFKIFEKFIEKLYSNSVRWERYFSYLNHIKTLYEKHKTNCCVIYFHCAEYFKCEEKYNPNYLLSNLYCNNQVFFMKEIYLQDVEKNSKKQTETSLSKDKTNIQDFKCRRVRNQVSKISHKIECEDKKAGDIEHVRIGKSPFIQELSFSFPNYQFIFNMIFAVIGIFFIFSLFYKFTSFGSIFHKRVQKKKRECYFDEEDINQLPRYSDYMETNSNSKRLRVAYDSASDTMR